MFNNGFLNAGIGVLNRFKLLHKFTLIALLFLHSHIAVEYRHDYHTASQDTYCTRLSKGLELSTEDPSII